MTLLLMGQLFTSPCHAQVAPSPSPLPATDADLPPPEATEIWSPEPAIIQATAGNPPSDAVILFNGRDLDNWEPVRAGEHKWSVVDGTMVVAPNPKPCDQRTKQAFGDIQLHLEFRTPEIVKGSSQGRGNSGVFFMGLYELQILDSYNNKTYVNGQVGAVYKQSIPLANPARPPGEWQSYDAVFIAPRFAQDGTLVSPARVSALLNNVLVQYNFAVRGPTSHRGRPPYSAHPDRLPLVLQDHRNPVAFRNIWVRELKLP